jgi:hypothetical protein
MRHPVATAAGGPGAGQRPGRPAIAAGERPMHASDEGLR